MRYKLLSEAHHSILQNKLKESIVYSSINDIYEKILERINSNYYKCDSEALEKEMHQTIMNMHIGSYSEDETMQSVIGMLIMNEASKRLEKILINLDKIYIDAIIRSIKFGITYAYHDRDKKFPKWYIDVDSKIFLEIFNRYYLDIAKESQSLMFNYNRDGGLGVVNRTEYISGEVSLQNIINYDNGLYASFEKYLKTLTEVYSNLTKTIEEIKTELSE